MDAKTTPTQQPPKPHDPNKPHEDPTRKVPKPDEPDKEPGDEKEK